MDGFWEAIRSPNSRRCGRFCSLKSDLGMEWVGDGLRLGALTALGAAGPGAVLTLASRWRLSLRIREGCLVSGPSLLWGAVTGG